MDYSLVNQFQDFIGNVYEIYGTIELNVNSASDSTGSKYISALLIDRVEDGDMTILEQGIRIFNNFTFPEYKEIFI